jgi:hypothetical protein
MKHVVNEVNTSSSWEQSERRKSNRSARAALRSGKGWDVTHEAMHRRSLWDEGRSTRFGPIHAFLEKAAGENRTVESVYDEVRKAIPAGPVRDRVLDMIDSMINSGWSRIVVEDGRLRSVKRKKKRVLIEYWTPGVYVVATAVGFFEVVVNWRMPWEDDYDGWPDSFGERPKEFSVPVARRFPRTRLKIYSKRQLSDREVKKLKGLL